MRAMTDVQGLCVIILLTMLTVPLWRIYDKLSTINEILVNDKKKEIR